MRLKRLELWWRTLWIRVLVRLMRRAGDARPDWSSRPMRVLFLRHDRAGDMILSTGVMRSIARSHGTITLEVLASPANAAVVRGADYIGAVVVFDKKRLASYVPTLFRLRRARYDAVIDCMVTAPSLTTLLLIAASGARYRVGIAGRGNDAAFNVPVPAEQKPAAHMVDLLAALGGAFGPPLDSAARHPALMISAEERAVAERSWGPRARGRRVLVNVSAGTAERTWPDDRFAALMRHVHELEPTAKIIVIGAPNEAERARCVAESGCGSYVETPSLREVLALVATSDFVFTPDTSVAHAASAFSRPAVAIFVRGKPERWGLYDTLSVNVEHTDGTLATLPLERVIAAVDDVWRRMRADEAAASD